MWYGERDENDPRRGLLGGTGLFSKEENKLKHLNSKRINAIHAAQRCAKLNDEKSRKIWLKKVGEYESLINEIKLNMEEMKNKIYISRPQEVIASKVEVDTTNGDNAGLEAGSHASENESALSQERKLTATSTTETHDKTLKSDRVKLFKYYRHENSPDWGVGRVMGITEQHIDILFTGVGMKRLRRVEAEQMLKGHSGKLNITELSNDPRFIESEKVLQQRHDYKMMQGLLPANTFELELKHDNDLPVAGTGRRAPDYLRRFHQKNRHF